MCQLNYCIERKYRLNCWIRSLSYINGQKRDHRPRESCFLWTRSKARANSGKHPFKNHWEKVFNSAVKELKHILSLWSHIKSLLKWFFKAASIWRKHTPFGRSESFWMRQLKTVAQGLQPIQSAHTLGAFPYERLGMRWMPKAPCTPEAHGPVAGGDRSEQSSVDTQEKESLGLPGWPRRASLSASNTIACIPQWMRMIGPAPDLSRSFQKKPPLTLTVKTVQRISWKEKKNLFEIEQGSANLCCRGPDNTHLGLCQSRKNWGCYVKRIWEKTSFHKNLTDEIQDIIAVLEYKSVKEKKGILQK